MSNWKLKFYGTFVAALLSVYLLLPTFLGLKEKREALLAQGQSEPWYYKILPANELNLGLDLRGGLYLELSADLEEATRHQINILISDITHYVVKDTFKDLNLTALANNNIRVEHNPEDRQTFLDSVQSTFGNKMVTADFNPKEIFFEVGNDAMIARKNVLEALKSEPELTNHVSLLKNNTYLAVSYADNAEKDKILNLLSQSEATKSLTPTEIPGILYLAPTPDYFANLKKDTLEQAANAVRNRIDRFGVVEANVSKIGNERLAVELPGIKNPDQIIDIIKQTGKLEFRTVNETLSQEELNKFVNDKKKELGIVNVYEKENSKKLNEALKAELPPDTSIAFHLVRNPMNKQVEKAVPYLLDNNVMVTGNMLSNAKVETQNNQPYVSMSFDKIGTKNFGDLTSANVGRDLAIVLDNVVMSSPRIRTAITGGQAQIELGYGNFQSLQKEAADLVLILKEGALPASLTVESKNVIGPSLGQASIDTGLKSLLIAAIAVVAFMILYYRVGGIITDVALLLNVLFIFAILCLFQASLSLPGIAGIVLTMGIAVDANVLIFERMREERVLGKTPAKIVEAGYQHAMSAIIDGNLTTLISGLVLFEFGTGPIKGFATTLIIGILTSMFTAVIVTHSIYDWMLDTFHVKKLSI